MICKSSMQVRKNELFQLKHVSFFTPSSWPIFHLSSTVSQTETAGVVIHETEVARKSFSSKSLIQ